MYCNKGAIEGLLSIEIVWYDLSMKKFLLNSIPYVLSIILRIPSFFEPHWYTDTGIYSAIGKSLNNNGILYKTIIDNKPPLIYYLFALLEKIPISLTFEYQFLSLLSLLGSEYLLYKIVENKFNSKIAFISIIFLAFFVGSTLFEGNLANVENFYMFFSLLSIYLVFRKRKKDKNLKYLYFAGCILGIGVLFKLPALFDGLFVILYFFYIYKFKDFFMKSLFYGLGSLSPIFLFFIYEYFRGVLSNSIYYIFLTNFKYVNYYKFNTIFGISHILFNTTAFIFLFFFFYILYKRKLIQSKTAFISLWLLTDLFSVFLSGRPYLHYLIQLSVPLSVVISYLIYKFMQSSIKIKIIIIISPLILIYVLQLYFFRAELSYQVQDQFISEAIYYPNFISFTLGDISQRKYFDTFVYNTNVVFEKKASTANINYTISNTLTKLGVSNHHIFIMGNFPWVYYMRNAIPASPYVADFMIYPFSLGADNIMNSLNNHHPYLILYYNDGYTFNRLNVFIKQFYRLYEIRNGAYIYIRD